MGPGICPARAPVRACPPRVLPPYSNKLQNGEFDLARRSASRIWQVPVGSPRGPGGFEPKPGRFRFPWLGLGFNSIEAGLVDPRRVSWKVPNTSPDDPAGTRQTVAVESTEIAAQTELRTVAAERAVPWRGRSMGLY
jgi:hypothetical protein